MHFAGRRFPEEIILTAVRWYLAYPLSFRQVEELLAERGVVVDHTTIHRWVVHYSPLLLGQFRRKQRKPLCIKGKWHYLYRAVDRHGKSIDFYLSPHRDAQAAYRFLMHAIRLHGCPEIITIDGYIGNRAAIERINADRATMHLRPIVIRHNRYLNNLIEQDHRAVKGRVRPMLQLKTLASAVATLAGIEMVHMLRKGQLRAKFDGLSLAQQFQILAA